MTTPTHETKQLLEAAIDAEKKGNYLLAFNLYKQLNDKTEFVNFGDRMLRLWNEEKEKPKGEQRHFFHIARLAYEEAEKVGAKIPRTNWKIIGDGYLKHADFMKAFHIYKVRVELSASEWRKVAGDILNMSDVREDLRQFWSKQALKEAEEAAETEFK